MRGDLLSVFDSWNLRAEVLTFLDIVNDLSSTFLLGIRQPDQLFDLILQLSLHAPDLVENFLT